MVLLFDHIPSPSQGSAGLITGLLGYLSTWFRVRCNPSISVMWWSSTNRCLVVLFMFYSPVRVVVMAGYSEIAVLEPRRSGIAGQRTAKPNTMELPSKHSEISCFSNITNGHGILRQCRVIVRDCQAENSTPRLLQMSALFHRGTALSQAYSVL